jgi:anti-sigma B factor antagonist
VGLPRPDLPFFSVEVIAGDDGSATVSVAGELDLATADEFSRAVRSGLAAGDVVIDLRKVTFMDSAGVRALDMAMREAAVSAGSLRVADGMPPSVVQVLKLTGMLELLPMDGPA